MSARLWQGCWDQAVARYLDCGIWVHFSSWRHSGFSVHNSVYLPPGDHQAVEALVRYMMRPPVSLARLQLLPGSDQVLHFPKGSGDDPGSATPERIDAMEYVACVLADPSATESTSSATMASIRAPPGENAGAARRPSTRPRPLMPRPHRLPTPRPRASDGPICSAVSTKWSASSRNPTRSSASSTTSGGPSRHVPGRLPYPGPRRQHPSEPRPHQAAAELRLRTTIIRPSTTHRPPTRHLAALERHSARI
jgi:hypothetical protein